MDNRRELVYEDIDDIQDIKNSNYYNNDNYKANIQDFLDKETSEPDINHFLNSEPESKLGIELLRKCVNYFFDKKWEALINYLNLVKIDDPNYQQYDSNNVFNLSERKVKFVRDYYMGIALFKLGVYQEARLYFRNALEIHDFPQLNYNIGLCNYKLGLIDDARFYFEKTIKKEEENQRLMKESQTKYEPRLSNTTSNTLKLFYKLGAECYFAKGNYQDCVPIILEALKFNPDDAEVWCIYAKVFIVKKSFEYAKPLLRKALELDPTYKEARDLLEILEKGREK